MSSGEIFIGAASDIETADLVEALVGELESFALERERVLAKLDIRSAQLARRIAREASVVSRGLTVAGDDAAREAVLETLGGLLGEAHRLLEGELTPSPPDDARLRSGTQRIDAIHDEARSVMHTHPTLQSIPSMVVDDEEDEDAGLHETIARRVVWERSGNRILGG